MSNNSYNRNHNRNYNRNYNRRASTRRNSNKRRNMQRYKNRAIIVTVALVMFLLIIFIFSAMFKSCYGTSDPLATLATETIGPSTESATGQATTEPASTANANSTNIDGFNPPAVTDNQAQATVEGSYLIWNDAAFESFKGSEDNSTSYVNALNSFAENSSFTIYNMVVPNHTEMGLPERVKSTEGFTTDSQATNISNIYSKLNSKIKAINSYNELSAHCNEYIFFNSDSHWTGLGGYYGYKAFAEATGQEILDISTCTENTIEGFTGSYTDSVSADIGSDTVSYWSLPYGNTMDVTLSDGTVQNYGTVYYENASSGSLTYGVYVCGENPLTVLKSDRATGKKIAVAMDSYGNAMAPYLTYNYDEVHLINYILWAGNLESYCSENGISEVMFINSVSSANTERHVNAVKSIL